MDIELERRRFEREMRSSLIQTGKHEESILVLSETPKILQLVGLKNLPIMFSQRHLRNILHEKGHNPHWHGLTLDEVLLFPSLLTEPSILMDSFSDDDSLILVLEKTDEEKLPLLAVIKANGKAQYECKSIDSNYLLSVYGKNNFDIFLERSLEMDFVLFAKKEKIQSIESFSELQLLGKFPENFEFNKILHQSSIFSNEE